MTRLHHRKRALALAGSARRQRRRLPISRAHVSAAAAAAAAAGAAKCVAARVAGAPATAVVVRVALRRRRDACRRYNTAGGARMASASSTRRTTWALEWSQEWGQAWATQVRGLVQPALAACLFSSQQLCADTEQLRCLCIPSVPCICQAWAATPHTMVAPP